MEYQTTYKQGQKLEIQNWKEIYHALDQMEDRLREQIIRNVHKSVARQTIVKDMKAALPYSSETKKGIGIKNVRGNKNAVWIGAMSDAYYLRFLEFGTKERETRARSRIKRKRSGGKTSTRNRGRIRANPILTRMVDGSIEQYILLLNTEYGNELAKWMQRKLDQATKKLAKL